MTDDQFKQLLEQNNAQLLNHMDEQLEERFEQNNAQLLKRLDERLDERLEQNNALLFGQLARHVGAQIGALRTDLTVATDRIYTAIDGLAKRVETDEQERAAIVMEQRRHNNWIGQLAKATKTKLVPEQ